MRFQNYTERVCKLNNIETKGGGLKVEHYNDMTINYRLQIDGGEIRNKLK